MEMVLRSDAGYFIFSGIKTKREATPYFNGSASVKLSVRSQRRCSWTGRAKERQSEAAA